MSATLDTNVVLRLVLKDIPEQYEIIKDLITAQGAQFRLSDMVAVDLVHALMHHYDLNRSQVAEILRSLLIDPNIDSNRALLESVIKSFVTHPSLSFVDCYLSEEAKATGNLPLVTFDKKLASQHDAAQLMSNHP